MARRGAAEALGAFGQQFDPSRALPMVFQARMQREAFARRTQAEQAARAEAAQRRRAMGERVKGYMKGLSADERKTFLAENWAQLAQLGLDLGPMPKEVKEQARRGDFVERQARRFGPAGAAVQRPIAGVAAAGREVGETARILSQGARFRGEQERPGVVSARMLAGQLPVPRGGVGAAAGAIGGGLGRIGRPIGVAGRALAGLPGRALQTAPTGGSGVGVQGWGGLSPYLQRKLIEAQRGGVGLRQQRQRVPWYIGGR